MNHIRNIKTKRDPNGEVAVGSSREPVLCAVGLGDGETLSVYGGLHNIRGNKSPYFTVTGQVYDSKIKRGDRVTRCGCMHEEILKRFPGLAGLVAMHLSDIYGKPMHAAANGWYDLVGSYDGALGEHYHVGNSKRHFPCVPPEDKPWANTEYRFPTCDEALQIFAEHIRAPIEEAERVRAIVRDVYLAELFDQGGDSFAAAPGHMAHELARAAAKKAWGEICATYTERWAREARECIITHDLVIFGDGGIKDVVYPLFVE